MSYLLAIDQGTTGSTAIILDHKLHVHAKVNREFPQHYPQPGWVEHDPEDIWSSVVDSVEAALSEAGIGGDQIKAIGITNQRETTMVWERATSKSLFNAIVWQCRRTEPLCQTLREAGHADFVAEHTGLVLDPYFSGTKARWILDHTDAHARAQAGELCFGTVDTFLVWRLTQGKSFVTDASNASRTMMMNVDTLTWDDQLLELLQVPRAMLPEIRGNAEVYGHTKGVSCLPDGIPIAGMAGDQQAALFGQACFEPGEAKCTYGTGAFLLMNTGSKRIRSSNKMLTSVAWRLGDTTTYALEGSTFIAGALVQWIRDGLRLIDNAPDIEPLAKTVPDNGGVVIVPSLTGLGAPHWSANARGVIWGLTRGTQRGHIARAALEGIANLNTDVLEAMEADLGRRVEVLKVDGGASANDLLMQIQSDLLGTSLSRPAMLETTALGAALLAGLGVGMFTDLSDIRAAWRADATFEPNLGADARAALRGLWKDGLARV